MRALQVMEQRDVPQDGGLRGRHGQARKGTRTNVMAPLALLLGAPLAALWGGDADAAGGGHTYRVQLVNNTCAELKITWDDGLACDTPDAPGCSITLRSQVTTNLNLNLERPAQNLKLHATGRCGGGSSSAPVRVAGDSDPGQVAKALQAADAPTVVSGTCVLSLEKMFPYEGSNLSETETVGPAPIVQPAPGGGYAYGSPVAGDPFGPVGPWGDPDSVGITTTIPDITSPVPVSLELGDCQPGADGVTQCGFACTAENRKGGLPTVYPGQLDNTD